MSLLGIDIRSTGCKATLYTDDGKLNAYAYREYKVNFNGQFAQLCPSVVWRSAKQCIR